MNVGELKEMLSDFPDETIIILQKDGEGNGFSPLSDIYEGAYVPDSTWSGEVMLLKLTDELIKEGFTEEDVADDGQHAVIFCPIN